MHLTVQVRQSAENFAGVASYRRQLVFAERTSERRHAVLASGDDQPCPDTPRRPRLHRIWAPFPQHRSTRGTARTESCRSRGQQRAPNQVGHPCPGEPLETRWRRPRRAGSECRRRTSGVKPENAEQDGGVESHGDDTDVMGMDPTRPHRRRPTDIVFVVAACLTTVALLTWALFL